MKHGTVVAVAVAVMVLMVTVATTQSNQRKLCAKHLCIHIKRQSIFHFVCALNSVDLTRMLSVAFHMFYLYIYKYIIHNLFFASVYFVYFKMEITEKWILNAFTCYECDIRPNDESGIILGQQCHHFAFGL